MKIICFSIVTIVGLCVAAIPFFKSGSDDIEDACFASFVLLAAVFFIVAVFGVTLFVI